MKSKLVFDLTPTKENGRNSEGSFLRAPDGSILFAYSRYSSSDWNDNASCDIAMVRSTDEGETWSEPELIARAAEFGTANIMSVSGVIQQDGSLGFYFLINENNGTTTLGRTLSKDGVHFTASRCTCNYVGAYYVTNNDRFVRLSDGRLVAPAAVVPVSDDPANPAQHLWDHNYTAVLLVSDDDGATFTKANPHVSLTSKVNESWGLQESGILERKNGVIWMWARTGLGRQYECFSIDGMNSFTSPEPSEFTSPDSPMQIVRAQDGTLYSVYNPIPNYNGRSIHQASVWGRTPLVVRKSGDDGITWGPLNVIEDDENRGYCYPAVFFTNDGAMLCAYCRGNEADRVCLARLGISKIPLSEIQ